MPSKKKFEKSDVENKRKTAAFISSLQVCNEPIGKEELLKKAGDDVFQLDLMPSFFTSALVAYSLHDPS